MKVSSYFTREHGVQAFVAMVALCAAALILTLTSQVKALRPQAAELRKRMTYPYVTQWVPTVRAATLDGDSVVVGETEKGRSQVLIFFTTTCQYCLQNLKHWKQVSQRVLDDSLRRTDVYWVSMSPPDSTRAYVAQHGITFPVVIPPDKKMTPVYRVRLVPMTLVLDYHGRIAHVNPGVLASPNAIDSVVTVARTVASPDTSKSRVSLLTSSQRP